MTKLTLRLIEICSSFHEISYFKLFNPKFGDDFQCSTTEKMTSYYVEVDWVNIISLIFISLKLDFVSAELNTDIII